MIGGKPRDYRKKGNGDDEPLRVFDKSKYDASSKNINGFIRHLPAGQKASERAILIAESYGYELKSDETYVTPFVRRQWLKRKPKNEEKRPPKNGERFYFFIPKSRRVFPFQKTFSKNAKSFLNSEKFCCYSRSFLVSENHATIIGGFTIGVAVLVCGSIE